MVDPALVQELVAARRRRRPARARSPRESARSSLSWPRAARTPGIARQLWVTEGTVEKHVHSILNKLRLPGNRGRPPPRARP